MQPGDAAGRYRVPAKVNDVQLDLLAPTPADIRRNKLLVYRAISA